MPLDSDVNNADSQLHVSFYEKEYGPDKGKPYVKIVIPGDQTNVIDQPVTDHHKKRFVHKWLAYQMQAGGDVPVVGTPLRKWCDEEPEVFTYGQMEEMTVLKFQTVEQIAGASDNHLQRVGMGGIGLRERAKAYLASKNKDETVSELSAMRQKMAEMEALLNARSAPVVTPMVIKRKPGRPKREPVNVKHDASTNAAGHE